MTGGIFSPSSLRTSLPTASVLCWTLCSVLPPPPCPGPAAPAQTAWPSHTPALRQDLAVESCGECQMRILSSRESSREKSCSFLGVEVGIETKSHTF